jgi:hypothetical protein
MLEIVQVFSRAEWEAVFLSKAKPLLLTLNPAIAARILCELSRPMSSWGVLSAAFFRIVVQHVFEGYPLAFPPAVVAVYEAAGTGEGLETPLAECGRCGYAHPRCFKTCVLCGGRVAVGARTARRIRSASLN